MNKIDPTLVGISLIGVVIVAGILIAASFSSAKAPVQYSASGQDRPKLEISEKSFDFGKMKLADTKTKEITLKNIGSQPLDIRNFSTSCGCTFVQVFSGDIKSSQFSMHSDSTWSTEVASGATARLAISYQPSLMPVKGEVSSREIYFKTNDPENPSVTISFKAFVE